MLDKRSIHVLNTHSSVLFTILRGRYHLNDIELNEEIFHLYRQTKQRLNEKNICYEKLKSALIPSTQKYKEFAFVFDTHKTQDTWYGWEVFNKLLPLLNRNSTQSFRLGDITADCVHSEIIREILFKSMKIINDTNFEYPGQYYVVYINHITNHEVKHIENTLREYPAYIGNVDVTFRCSLKLILSICLCSAFIKHKNYFIQAHPSDVEDSENLNMAGYDFSAHGFKYISVNSDSYDIFLNFRIDAGRIEKEEHDFSLLSISENIISLSECNIVVSKDKFDYLQQEKGEILLRLGIKSRNDIQRIIKENLSFSSLYNLNFSPNYNESKFNIFAESLTMENSPAKSMVSLKYLPNKNTVFLVTMV